MAVWCRRSWLTVRRSSQRCGVFVGGDARLGTLRRNWWYSVLLTIVAGRRSASRPSQRHTELMTRRNRWVVYRRQHCLLTLACTAGDSDNTATLPPCSIKGCCHLANLAVWFWSNLSFFVYLFSRNVTKLQKLVKRHYIVTIKTVKHRLKLQSWPKTICHRLLLSVIGNICYYITR